MAADQTRTHAPRTTLGMERLEDRTTPAAALAAFADGRVLVGITPGLESIALTQIAASGLTTTTQSLGFNIYKVNLQAGVSVPQAIASLTGKFGVRYAEPDYLRHIALAANDPQYADGTKWDLHNTGQFGATPGADIDAEAGWDFGTGTGDHIVAIMDTGIDYTHPDLAANMWTNPADGSHGFDFVNNDTDPSDDNGHGTNVAGIAGAVGNNGIGVTGVAWTTRLMAVKVADAQGGLTASDIIAGENFAITNGAKILNESFGGGGFSQAELDAATAARDAGVIIVAAAGNDSADNDVTPHYPANFNTMLDNVISVASIDWTDHLSFFSDFGATTVNLAAPGGAGGSINDPLDGIASTAPGGGYAPESGTSQATPHVTGALAVFWDSDPTMTYQEVIQSLYQTVRPNPNLVGKMTTGGELDLGELMGSVNHTYFATGAGAVGAALVNVYRSSSGRPLTSFVAYDLGFTGGVRVATGDFNGDGFSDIVTVPGKGGAPHVKIYDGKTFQVIASFFAFESQFTGGLYVAAGDVNGDGLADVVVSADSAGGPRVSVFDFDPTTGATGMIGNFFAYDPGFTGGVRLAVGDFDGDGQNDIVTAAGFGGGPHVKVFSAPSVLAGSPVAVRSFIAGSAGDRNGVFVSTGDFNGDKLADIVVSTGAGNTPSVVVYNGTTLAPMAALTPPFGAVPGLLVQDDLNVTAAPIQRAFPENILPPSAVPSQLPQVGNNQSPRDLNGYIYGVRVATHDVNRDGVPDLILAGGPADAPAVSIINGKTFAVTKDFDAYVPFFYGGVFVGGAVPVQKPATP